MALPKMIPLGVLAGSGLYLFMVGTAILPQRLWKASVLRRLLEVGYCGSISSPMSSQFQIRKALGKLSNVAAFIRRHDVSERTVYRQRAPDPPRMRAAVANKIELALIQEGLLRAPKEKPAPPIPQRRSTDKSRQPLA
jgi:hypothetical protein